VNLESIAVWLQAETIAALRADVERLTSELKASETDRSSMKDTINELNQELATLSQPSTTASVISVLEKPSPTDSQVENVNGVDLKHCNIKSNNLPTKPQPKV